MDGRCLILRGQKVFFSSNEQEKIFLFTQILSSMHANKIIRIKLIFSFPCTHNAYSIMAHLNCSILRIGREIITMEMVGKQVEKRAFHVKPTFTSLANNYGEPIVHCSSQQYDNFKQLICMLRFFFCSRF